MKKVIAVISLLFSVNAFASDAMERLSRFVDSMEEAGGHVAETVQYTAVSGSASVSAISQFVWSEIQAATEEIQGNINALQKKLDNHIYADKREHARLQAQINALKVEMARLKAQQKK